MLTVPSVFADALMPLRDMDDDQFGRLLDAANVALNGATAFASCASETTDLEQQQAQHLLDALIAVVIFAEESGENIKDVIRDLSETSSEDAKEPDSQRLRARIASLVEHEQVKILHKSVAVSLEHDRLYMDSRIITDIRPVFSDEVRDGVKGAMLTHVLRIDALHAGQRESYYVALDKQDLASLKSAVLRAEEKDMELQATLEVAKIPRLVSSEEG